MHKDKEKHLASVKARNIRVAAENRQKIKEYLLLHPCIDCGETDPIVLEFDHVRGKKHNNVTSLVYCSWKKIQEEIDKCEVRCANCHRRRTYAQLGWK